jgi:excisionase family DNA binding protein
MRNSPLKGKDKDLPITPHGAGCSPNLKWRMFRMSKVITIPNAPDALLTSNQVCTILQICGKTLQRLCAKKKISFIKVSRTCFRFRRAAVDTFIAQREVRAS